MISSALKINHILQTPLWARISKMHDVGRICGYSLKIMPTQSPVSVYTDVSHDDQTVVTGSDALEIFMKQPSLRIDNLKDEGFYRSVNLKGDHRFREFIKLTGGSGMSGILQGIAGSMDTRGRAQSEAVPGEERSLHRVDCGYPRTQLATRRVRRPRSFPQSS